MATIPTTSPYNNKKEPSPIVPTMIDDAAKATIKTYSLRENISVLEGSGGNIEVLAGKDGKLLGDSGLTCRSHGFGMHSRGLVRTLSRSYSTLTGTRITPMAMLGCTMQELKSRRT